MERRCEHCGKKFIPLSNIPGQRYCSCRQCQNARRKKWRKQKLAIDQDYKGNQADAQRRWCEKNKGYWGRYRASHPEYVERNRQLQRVRNQRRKGVNEASDTSTMIAKRYALSQEKTDISGYYKLVPAGPQMIAKSDVLLVKLDFISTGYPHGL